MGWEKKGEVEKVSDEDGQDDTLTIVREKVKVREPKLYKVLLHNDDYTTMDFVIHILKNFFNKSDLDAQQIMLKVHRQGVGTCGIYTREIAETKVALVREEAQKEEHPLLCTYEPES